MEWKDLSNAEHVIEITKLAAEFIALRDAADAANVALDVFTEF